MNPRHRLLSSAAAAARDCTRPVDADGTVVAYVGTYPPRGQGLHRFRLDPASGALRPLGITASGDSPTWLALSADGRRLYTANEGAGSVSAYAVDPCDGALHGLNSVSSGGLLPVHLSLHPGGRHLFVANYGSGSVAVLPVLDDGRLAPPCDLQQDRLALGAAGPPWGARVAAHAPPGSFAISGHDEPHAHMVQSDPQGRFVLANDLGLDCTLAWRFDAAAGRLHEPRSVAASPGAGPRHFAWHPNGRWLYSLNEEASTLAVLDHDPVTGQLQPRREVSCLPAGYAGTSYASGLVMAPHGRWLWTLNRLHDSIATFSIGRDGLPVLVDEAWTRGAYPRSCQLAPGGRFLYVCNQHSDNLTVFAVGVGGRLRFTGDYVPVGAPAVIDFLVLGR